MDWMSSDEPVCANCEERLMGNNSNDNKIQHLYSAEHTQVSNKFFMPYPMGVKSKKFIWLLMKSSTNNS
jgi:hypothetical protein